MVSEHLGGNPVVATIEPWLVEVLVECLQKYDRRDIKITVKNGRVAGAWIDLGKKPNEDS